MMNSSLCGKHLHSSTNDSNDVVLTYSTTLSIVFNVVLSSALAKSLKYTL